MRKTKTQKITELTSSFILLNEKYNNLLYENEQLENKYDRLKFDYEEKIKILNLKYDKRLMNIKLKNSKAKDLIEYLLEDYLIDYNTGKELLSVLGVDKE